MTTGLIGCGKMGSALVLGAIRAGVLKADEVLVYDVYPAAAEALQKEEPVRVAESLAELFESCELLLLCTKPGEVTGVLRQLAEAGLDKKPLLLSIAAGVSLRRLEGGCQSAARVVRAMPNTPALIGQGAAAFSLGNEATDGDAELAKKILGAVGTVSRVAENLLDAVTGLSGSGPAYVYTFIEALADGGVKNGLPRAEALALATQTVLGAAAMVKETGKHPAVLRDEVTSPGGTTIAGLAALEKGGFRAACWDAVEKATRRAKQIGRPERGSPGRAR